ncbi:condensation domain-containing protein, partial [uncultured Shewanella sp.]|uniref:thioesterase domain-containing protein n=1 Tax=uncultured Shewanella sp. TaxID=173975 RepID=UPI0026292C6F
IWQTVLGLEQVGIEDHFFQIGGDSIFSIQLVTRMSQEGFCLQIKDLFEAPTVAQLMKRLSNIKSEIKNAEQGILQGGFGLSPIQQFSSINNNGSMFFVQNISAEFTATQIKEMLVSLVEYHDILRVRYQLIENIWTQEYLKSQPQSPLVSIDMKVICGEELRERLSVLQASLNIETGPLWRVVHIKEEEVARLVFIMHPLIFDSDSWNILSNDIQLLLMGQTLAPKTNSYRQWVSEVADYASENEVQVAYWRQITEFHIDWSKLYSESQHKIHWSKCLTGRLLKDAPRGYHTQIKDLLLSALSIALNTTFNRKCSLITLEGRGREAISRSLDTSRTLGCFTTEYPIILQNKDTVEDTIIHTKEMLRAIPDEGIGYGALIQSGELQRISSPINFNFINQSSDNNGYCWPLCHKEYNDNMSPMNHENYLLNLSGTVKNGQLVFYICSQLSNKKVGAFLESFQQAVQAVTEAACSQEKQGGLHTPSDVMIQNQKSWIEYYRASDTKETLIVFPIHGLGYEMWLNTLLPEISSDIHLVLFDTDRERRFANFDTWATELVEKIVSENLCPQGHCSILGWSFGAVLGYLVAVKLQTKGIIVNQTFLMDPIVLSLISDEPLIQKEDNWYRNLQMPLYEKKVTVYQCTEPADESIHVLKAVQSDGLGFRQLCSDLSVVHIPCQHYQMMNNDVAKKRLFEHLKKCLYYWKEGYLRNNAVDELKSL